MSNLYRFNPLPLYRKSLTTPKPWHCMAAGVARWLLKISEALENKNLPFEACDAEDLASEFEKFAIRNGLEEDFPILWQDLEEWGSGTINVAGREVTLCEIPSFNLTFRKNISNQ